MNTLYRSIVITGGSSGIGAALAEHYAGPGVRLLLVARDAGRAETVARACRSKGALVELALVDIRDTDALVARLQALEGTAPVDLVIANAGVEFSLGPDRTAERLPACIEQIRVNFEGAVATVTPLIEAMRRRRRGAIVLVSSLAALEPLPDQPVYSAAKAAVAAWGKALRAWLAPSNVVVTVVYPGFVATGMVDRYRGARPFQLSAAAAAERIAAAVARGRAEVAFPWQLVWLIRLGRLSPRAVRDRVLRTWFRFEIVP